jgi:hypothetical protein
MNDAATPDTAALTEEHVIAQTKRWLERAVIGLRLCPFARAVYVNERVRYVVAMTTSSDELAVTLADELTYLAQTDPSECETTLIIHPHVLNDFDEYNQFLEFADVLISETALEGVLQVASFHPQYRFEDTDPNDIENFTNRSPYPTLHLLREESISRAVDEFPDVDEVGARNQETMRALGHEGWRKLWESE